MGEYFPSYGELKYIYSEAIQDDHCGVPTTDVSPRYTCELDLFGQTITTSDMYCDKSEGLEAVSKIGWSILSELVRTVFGNHDPFVNSIFTGVIEDLRSFRSANTIMPDQEEITEPLSSQRSILLRVSEAIQGNSTPTKNAQANSEAMSQMILPNPISSLHEYARGKFSNPIIEEFSAHGLFGCRVVFNDKVYVVEARYKKKSDARNEAAKLACIDIFGNKFAFEETQNEAPPTVDPSKFSFGTSFDSAQ